MINESPSSNLILCTLNNLHTLTSIVTKHFTEEATSTFATVKHLSLRLNNHVTQTESHMREECDCKLDVLSVCIIYVSEDEQLQGETFDNSVLPISTKG